jgi:(2R)-ethylmalonyl-CoA mutase
LLTKAGVARVYTPKDFDLTQIMRDITAVVDGAWKSAA